MNKYNTTLKVSSLEEIELKDLESIKTVIYTEKGTAGHIEILCRVRGIELIPAGKEYHQDDASRELQKIKTDTLPKKYQISVFDQNECTRANFQNISSVFVRSEHLLYRLAKFQHLSINNVSFTALETYLDEICKSIPDGVRLLYRGLDLRSNDKILTESTISNEDNPELGKHGVRMLLRTPDWVLQESMLLRKMEYNYPHIKFTYAVPFITTISEFEEFEGKWRDHFSHIAPFIESPAALTEFALHYHSSHVYIGLKDICQFYYASDRAEPPSRHTKTLTDWAIVQFVTDNIIRLSKIGTEATLYQTIESIELYGRILTRECHWTASMTVDDLNRINQLEAEK